MCALVLMAVTGGGAYFCYLLTKPFIRALAAALSLAVLFAEMPLRGAPTGLFAHAGARLSPYRAATLRKRQAAVPRKKVGQRNAG